MDQTQPDKTRRSASKKVFELLFGIALVAGSVYLILTSGEIWLSFLLLFAGLGFLASFCLQVLAPDGGGYATGFIALTIAGFGLAIIAFDMLVLQALMQAPLRIDPISTGPSFFVAVTNVVREIREAVDAAKIHRPFFARLATILYALTGLGVVLGLIAFVRDYDYAVGSQATIALLILAVFILGPMILLAYWASKPTAKSAKKREEK